MQRQEGDASIHRNSNVVQTASEFITDARGFAADIRVNTFNALITKIALDRPFHDGVYAAV